MCTVAQNAMVLIGEVRTDKCSVQCLNGKDVVILLLLPLKLLTIIITALVKYLKLQTIKMSRVSLDILTIYVRFQDANP
jgi:hypothetical protein